MSFMRQTLVLTSPPLRGVLVWALLTLGSLSAAWGQALEYQIKAAFLYKFCSYIEWPAQAFERPDTPIVIGIAGPESIADELSQITNGHAVNGRSLQVRKLRRGDPLTGLHVLFVTRAEAARTAEAMSAAKLQSMLLVTESDPTMALESIINFVVINDKVRFDISLPSAEQNNLKISARLLAVARKVIQRPAS